jgi:hypothetical protein
MLFSATFACSFHVDIIVFNGHKELATFGSAERCFMLFGATYFFTFLHARFLVFVFSSFFILHCSFFSQGGDCHIFIPCPFYHRNFNCIPFRRLPIAIRKDGCAIVPFTSSLSIFFLRRGFTNPCRFHHRDPTAFRSVN